MLLLSLPIEKHSWNMRRYSVFTRYCCLSSFPQSYRFLPFNASLCTFFCVSTSLDSRRWPISSIYSLLPLLNNSVVFPPNVFSICFAFLAWRSLQLQQQLQQLQQRSTRSVVSTAARQAAIKEELKETEQQQRADAAEYKQNKRKVAKKQATASAAALSAVM